MESTIKVSSRRAYPSYVGLAKDMFKDKHTIELHGLGEAITNAIRASEMLISLGYATLDKFGTFTSTENDPSGTTRSKPKVVIVLSKGPGYEKACQDFESSKKTKNI